ncbi:MAG: Gfo/Idh/MocA family oxidoreductase [Candidatus Hydrogenedentes bacterium]|nr:Gfo/Idh/MocA family oxidoreductase [Candidatus Hydrogenedentota bacterium]
MLNVAMLSAWHAHAKGYAERLSQMPEVKIAAVWDEDPARGEPWAKELNAEWVPNLDAVMKRADIQGVVIDAPTNRHAEIMVAAANAGKHIFTEKVMALTIDECNRVSDAVRAAGVKFCISFPFRARPTTRYAYQAVQDGLLGQLTFFRVRVAHNAGSAGWLPPHFWEPVATGGGAMMDLGAHPMYVASWFGGQPKKISSTFTYITGHEVEDNAVCVIEFEGGLIGVTETSFMSTNSPYSLELSGTEGYLFIGAPDDKRVQIKSNKLDNKEWTTPELPPELPRPERMWVEGILNGTPIPFGLEEGTKLTELMQYAYMAHREGRQVEIPKRG